jgi:hypothetical protein
MQELLVDSYYPKSFEKKNKSSDGQKIKKATMNRQIYQDSPDKWPKRQSDFPYPMTPSVLPAGKCFYSRAEERIGKLKSV